MLLLARLGEDGDFKGSHVAVDATVLEFFLLVEAPARLARDAETGVVEDDDERSIFAQVLECGPKEFEGIAQVLYGEDACGMGKFFAGKIEGMCKIMDKELMGGFG